MPTFTLPTEPAIETDSLRLFKSGQVPVAMRWLRWHDSWRHADRDCRWYGACITCGRNTYAFDDGENDPRGALGDNALWPVDEDGRVRTCAICANDHDAYQAALRKAAQDPTACRPIHWPGVNDDVWALTTEED